MRCTVFAFLHRTSCDYLFFFRLYFSDRGIALAGSALGMACALAIQSELWRNHSLLSQHKVELDLLRAELAYANQGITDLI